MFLSLCVVNTLAIPVMSSHDNMPMLMEICGHRHVALPHMNKRRVLDVAMPGMTKIPTTLWQEQCQINPAEFSAPLSPAAGSWIFSRNVTWLEVNTSKEEEERLMLIRGQRWGEGGCKIGVFDMAVTGTWIEHRLSPPPFDNLRICFRL